MTTTPAPVPAQTPVQAPLKLNSHPQRQSLFNEVHARPFPVVRAPLRVSYLAVLTGESGREWELAQMIDLCRRLNLPPIDSNPSSASIQYGNTQIRWERHTEFYTLTLFEPGPYEHPFNDPPIRRLPEDWLAGLAGQVIVALHLTLEPPDQPERSRDQLHEIFDGARLIGSHVVEENAIVWSPFRIHADGFSRILIEDRKLTDCRAGRLVQRLLELETYRLLALTALPLARETGPRFTAMNQALLQIVEGMAMAGSIDDERRLLTELSCQAAQIEALRAKTNYRFSAAAAYDALIQRRLEELRETQINGIQTIAEFLDRRVTPALRTCESVADRLEDLSRRTDRAGELLRTRIELTLEMQNQQLLESMDKRARLQLWLQRTVEGLSVAAVSYYLLGLVKYGADAVEAAGLQVRHELVVGIAMPIVLGAVWLGVRRLHRLIEEQEAVK